MEESDPHQEQRVSDTVAMLKAMEMVKNNLPWMKRVKKITLGVCAMDKKVKSKAMKEILSRLPTDFVEIVFFGDECILNSPIEAWPVVEVLIAFYSTRFPTEKALAYIELNKPIMINDLKVDSLLKDRRQVYALLKSQGIDIPRHVILNRGPDDPPVTVEEFDEFIVVDGVQINKPLVEKPANAEDHNIYIYYPQSAGGGSKRLFRKVNDRSSEFYPSINELRREGSYIYEEFMITQGTDVKVYTVGPDYAHAEARKSPVVDGRVKRDTEGHEVRYPVILSPQEKIIARKIVTAFKQTVCGFDILRAEGKSYCCDVNGFSFVKNSRKYYDDASQILMEIMLQAVRGDWAKGLAASQKSKLQRQLPSPAKHRALSNVSMGARTISAPDHMRSDSISSDADAGLNCSMHSMDSSLPAQGAWRRGQEEQEELRCVIAIVRHADRTPKQKMKIKTTHRRYLDYFHGFAKSPYKDLKVKSKAGLLQFLQVTKDIIAELRTSDCNSELLWKLSQIRDVLSHKEISGINRKLQMKPQRWEEGVEEGKGLATEIMLILKWGGDLTPLGREQAERLGTQFRQCNYPDHEGGGVLRLHSTYRHDLKIKASDEGRVMKTAAAFAKGLLELEGPLTPILASLVTVEEKNRPMLDREGNFEIKEEMDRCKKRLDRLQVDKEMDEELVNEVAPGCSKALRAALYSLGNPLTTLRRMQALLEMVRDQLKAKCVVNKAAQRQELLRQIREEAEVAEAAKAESEAVEAEAEGAGAVGGVKDEKMDAPPPPPLGEGTGIAERALKYTPLLVPRPKHTPLSSSSIDSVDAPPLTPLAGTIRCDSPMVDSPMTPPTEGALHLSETIDIMFDRWDQLCADFSKKGGMFDLTKVPDVYDMTRYDLLHNPHLALSGMYELHALAKNFENCVVPQEYGSDEAEKRQLGSKMCGVLLEKINYDLNFALNRSVDEDPAMLYRLDESHAGDLHINSLGRSVRTRLYFTSESHMHTLLNVLKYSGDKPLVCPEGLAVLDSISEIGYLSQIVIRLFEDRLNPENVHCELNFSPGAVNDPLSEESSEVAPTVLLDKGIKCDTLIEHLGRAIKLGVAVV